MGVVETISLLMANTGCESAVWVHTESPQFDAKEEGNWQHVYNALSKRPKGHIHYGRKKSSLCSGRDAVNRSMSKVHKSKRWKVEGYPLERGLEGLSSAAALQVLGDLNEFDQYDSDYESGTSQSDRVDNDAEASGWVQAGGLWISLCARRGSLFSAIGAYYHHRLMSISRVCLNN